MDALPEEWKRVTFGDVCELRKETIDPADASDSIYIGLEHLRPAEVKIREWGSPGDVRSSKNVFHEGDILYGKLRPYLDKAAIADDHGICSTDILVLKPYETITVNSFLINLIHTRPFIGYSVMTMAGVNHPRTSWKSLANFEFYLPPLREQKRIAAVLSAVQEAKEKTEAVIQAARELKKSLMKHLFIYGPVSVEEAENVPLKETEIGLVSEEWNTFRLEDITDFRNGINFTKEQKGNSGILTIDVLNMYCDGVYIDLSSLYRVDKNISEDHILRDGDILFVRSSLKQEGVGWTSLFKGIQEPVTYCGFIIRARLNSNDLIPEYLTNYLRTNDARSKLIASSGKVAITNINQGMLGRILVPVPSYPVQQKIADIFSALDHKIEAEENKKKALEELFKTLLSNLMTGKIRVNQLEMEL